MGLKFKKDYSIIVSELSAAIKSIPNLRIDLAMDLDDWNEISKTDLEEIIKTFADDIFYSLGTDPTYLLNSGCIKVNSLTQSIDVFLGENLSKSIKL